MDVRRKKPTGQLQRASTIRISNHEIAIYWWIYRWCYLEAKRVSLAERTQLDPQEHSQTTQRRSQALMNEVPAEDRATFDAHFDKVLRRATRAAQADPHVDPDRIERQVIEQLIAEAEDKGDGYRKR